jgi:hypothetical protein
MPTDRPSNYWREIPNTKAPNTKKHLQIKIFNIEISLEFGIWCLGFAHLNALGSGLTCAIRAQIELQSLV